MNVLIVDDDSFTIDVLRHALRKLGHDVSVARNGEEALEILRRDDIRLAITDWDMPGMSGLDLCRAVRADEVSGYTYLIMLTGRNDAASQRQGLTAGADDFLFKPLDADDLAVCFKTAERVLALESRDVALFAMAKLAESRDPDTAGHIERVQAYARLLAQNLARDVKQANGVNAEFVRLLHLTSALHDLGKVAVPDSILLKPGKLTKDEFEIMKLHTTTGSQTLDAALRKFPSASFLRMARDIAASHHERYDGSGYPAKLVGEQIPLCARIVALADVYDALTSRRVYKEAVPHASAKQFIVAASGSHFDPAVVESFMRCEQQIIKVRADTTEQSLVSPCSTPAVAIAEPPPASILVVEDSPLLLTELIDLLRNTNHIVLSANNVQDAITLFAKHRPDIVVSDFEMPGGTGLDLCIKVRQYTSGVPVHFIMLTAHSDQQTLLQAYAAGVNDFVPKPFHPQELLARVNAGLRVCEMHRELAVRSERLISTNSQLKVVNMRLDRLSTVDELTGLFNRRHALVHLQEQWSLAEQSHRGLTIAALDVDHFKTINDTYGHEAGDVVLRRVAAVVSESIRGTDIACRMGGEEFLIIFPSQTLEDVAICAERLRSNIERHVFQAVDAYIHVTVSIGLACRDAHTASPSDLIRTADKNLYQAKHNGRNQVHVHGEATMKLNISFPAGTPATVQQGLNFETVLARCGGDRAFAKAVCDRYLAQSPGELKRLEDAFAANQPEQFGRAAHTLKSMSAYVGADAVADLCQRLETSVTSGHMADMQSMVHLLRKELNSLVAPEPTKTVALQSSAA